MTCHFSSGPWAGFWASPQCWRDRWSPELEKPQNKNESELLSQWLIREVSLPPQMWFMFADNATLPNMETANYLTPLIKGPFSKSRTLKNAVLRPITPFQRARKLVQLHTTSSKSGVWKGELSWNRVWRGKNPVLAFQSSVFFVQIIRVSMP